MIDYRQDVAGEVSLATSDTDEKLLVPARHDFVLVVSDGKVYLISGGQALTTTELWAGSKRHKVVAEVKTRGILTKLRREDRFTVSMLEEAENVVCFTEQVKEVFQDKTITQVLRYHDRPGGAAGHCVPQQSDQGVCAEQQCFASVSG